MTYVTQSEQGGEFEQLTRPLADGVRLNIGALVRINSKGKVVPHDKAPGDGVGVGGNRFCKEMQQMGVPAQEHFKDPSKAGVDLYYDKGGQEVEFVAPYPGARFRTWVDTACKPSEYLVSSGTNGVLTTFDGYGGGNKITGDYIVGRPYEEVTTQDINNAPNGVAPLIVEVL